QQVAVLCRALGAPQILHHETLPERDRRGLEDAAAAAARGILFAGAYAREGAIDRRALAALHAHHLAPRAVDLADRPRRLPGFAAQPVDVLCDQRVGPATPLELHERAMARVRLAVVHAPLEEHPPRALAHLGIGHVVADRGHLLRFRVPGPEPLRTAKIRDARIGGDARAREHDDPPRLLDPAAHRGDRRILPAHRGYDARAPCRPRV